MIEDKLLKLDSAMSQIPYDQSEAIVLRLHGQVKLKTTAKL